MGHAPALAEGTSGVEPAGEAERATAAKFEALVSWAQGVTRHDIERLPHEGKHAHELPQKGAWPRHPYKRASTTSRCCQQVKAEASPIKVDTPLQAQTRANTDVILHGRNNSATPARNRGIYPTVAAARCTTTDKQRRSPQRNRGISQRSSNKLKLKTKTNKQ